MSSMICHPAWCAGVLAFLALLVPAGVAPAQENDRHRDIVSLRLQRGHVLASTATGLFRARLDKQQWQQLHGKTVPPPGGRFVAGAPDDRVLFYLLLKPVGKAKGLYRSTDLGDTWDLMSDAHDFIAVVRLPGGRLFATATAPNQEREIVLLSENDGRAWKDVTNGVTEDYPQIRLEPDPEHPQRVCLINPFAIRRGGTVLQAKDDQFNWKERYSGLDLVEKWPPDALKTPAEFFAVRSHYGYQVSWSAGKVRQLPEEFPGDTFRMDGTGIGTHAAVVARLDNYFNYPFGERLRIRAFDVVAEKQAYEFRPGQPWAVTVALVYYDDRVEPTFLPRLLDGKPAKLFWGLKVIGPGGKRIALPPDRYDPFGHLENEALNIEDAQKQHVLEAFQLKPGKPWTRSLDLRELGLPDEPGTYRVQAIYCCGFWRDRLGVTRRLDLVPGQVFTVTIKK